MMCGACRPQASCFCVCPDDVVHQLRETQKKKRTENELMNQEFCNWRDQKVSGCYQNDKNVKLSCLAHCSLLQVVKWCDDVVGLVLPELHALCMCCVVLVFPELHVFV